MTGKDIAPRRKPGGHDMTKAQALALLRDVDVVQLPKQQINVTHDEDGEYDVYRWGEPSYLTTSIDSAATELVRLCQEETWTAT